MEQTENTYQKTDLLVSEWLRKEPYFGSMKIKSHLLLNSPYSKLSFEERKEFLNGIRKEYINTMSEYCKTKSEWLKSKSDKLKFKIIDDTMNYFLFLVDKSQEEFKSAEHQNEKKAILIMYGIESVDDILEKHDEACECIEQLIERVTYKVLVPFNEITSYFAKFEAAKQDYDKRIVWEADDNKIHMYV